jgi:hypothetical protein
MADEQKIILVDQIEPMILDIRGQKVLLDRDLARIYGVPTRRLNEHVRRNRARFPDDFLFQLTKEEFENWRSQIASSNSTTKMGLRRRPYAFTEHGAIMAATVLKRLSPAECAKVQSPGRCPVSGRLWMARPKEALARQVW